jgi:hypothetical protein
VRFYKHELDSDSFSTGRKPFKDVPIRNLKDKSRRIGTTVGSKGGKACRIRSPHRDGRPNREQINRYLGEFNNQNNIPSCIVRKHLGRRPVIHGHHFYRNRKLDSKGLLKAMNTTDTPMYKKH